MNGPATIAGDVISVIAGLLPGRQPLGTAFSVDPAAKEVKLGGVLRRRSEVDPTPDRVLSQHERLTKGAGRIVQVKIARGEEALLASVAGDEIEMAVAVPFTDPGEALSPVDPAQVVSHIHPGTVPLGVHRSYLAGLGISQRHH